MTVLTFDDVTYSKAEAEARRQGVDLGAEINKLGKLVTAYAHDAEVREAELAEGDKIAGTWRTHEDIRRYLEDVKREAGIDA
ncbi:MULTISPECIES: hypothetical protein [Bifidobacterium]|jgi:hypothetical protein|uniref:Uncharacterized protein n=1 Tax=Bifidobacterium tibiigranuli TaxID=2172043 RepID=A0A5N6S064_9BIFI|nr:hypothetical protein [Bifidobacterium tibiigranuli]KAE8127526.1 hypothetical protein DDE84_08645 [Bifidobacterium tibiigranuli]KAE8127975.1 hypothetical protein DDF78_07630 [Bifidobacterium tibiigranuli]MCI1211049.1 hypothetical protein [Bifidobacterium tibiigranuli]MCI1221814.1 hypothetical protein [Bifidobacterium tibiigranuli]